MIPNALDLLTIFVGISVIIGVIRLGILVRQLLTAEDRASALREREERIEKRLLEHREGTEEYQRRNRELQDRSDAIMARNEKHAEHWEVLRQLEVTNSERLSAILVRVEGLVARTEQKPDSK
jgi:uncharacterized membrane protein YccC